MHWSFRLPRQNWLTTLKTNCRRQARQGRHSDQPTANDQTPNLIRNREETWAWRRGRDSQPGEGSLESAAHHRRKRSSDKGSDRKGLYSASGTACSLTILAKS